MNDKKLKASWTALLGLIAMVSFSIGVNGWVGLGVFACLWCIAGIIELNDY